MTWLLVVVSLLAHACGGSSNGAAGPAEMPPRTERPTSPPMVRGVGTPSSPVVLKFVGTPFSHVNHGLFWQPGAKLGNFFWEAWVAFDSAEGYVISDGYGGTHALLWGPTGGNVWNGKESISFSIDDGVPLGQWHHAAVGMAQDEWGDTWIWTYVNGICAGKTRFHGQRQGAIIGGGGGVLYVGGSDHSNGSFRLAMLRGFEDGENPYGADPGRAGAAFVPQRYFGAELTLGSRAYAYADFLASYMVPTWIVDDLSDGYDHGAGGMKRRHPGRLGGSTIVAGVDEPLTGWPVPDFVVDETSPFRAPGPPLPASRGLAPVTAPIGALVFDSFSRDDQTPAFQEMPTLGVTESGSLGSLTWRSGVANGHRGVQGGSWGIINGRAVYLEKMPGVAWVDVGVSDQDVRVSRHVGVTPRREVALAFRVLGPDDHRGCGYIERSDQVGCWRREAGRLLSLGEEPGLTQPPANWTTLRVVAKQSAVTVYVDDSGGGWVTLGTLQDNSPLDRATAAGIVNFTAIEGAGAQSLARYDDFAVFQP